MADNKLQTIYRGVGAWPGRFLTWLYPERDWWAEMPVVPIPKPVPVRPMPGSPAPVPGEARQRAV